MCKGFVNWQFTIQRNSLSSESDKIRLILGSKPDNELCSSTLSPMQPHTHTYIYIYIYIYIWEKDQGSDETSATFYTGMLAHIWTILVYQTFLNGCLF